MSPPIGASHNNATNDVSRAYDEFRSNLGNDGFELLGVGAGGDPAIAAPERTPLDFASLKLLAENTVKSLNNLGLGRGDRIAIVLPNGPEMAASFVTVASACSTAPLNPAYRKKEFDFYLSDLNAKALIVDDGSTSPALDVARERNIPILKLNATSAAPAGSFTISGATGTAAKSTGLLGPTMKRWSCTPREPPRALRSCRSRTQMFVRRRTTFAEHWRWLGATVALTLCRCFISTA